MKHIQLIGINLLLVTLASAEPPADPVASLIQDMRKTRETTIAEVISKTNEDYETQLNKLQSLFSSNKAAAQMVQQEKEELAKVSVVTLPAAVRITTPLANAGDEKMTINDSDDLARYLVGTKWKSYTNGMFLGDAKELEFTGPETTKFAGKEGKWKALDKKSIWLSGDVQLNFSKNYTEFSGNWIPNPLDKRSGRIIQESPSVDTDHETKRGLRRLERGDKP